MAESDEAADATAALCRTSIAESVMSDLLSGSDYDDEAVERERSSAFGRRRSGVSAEKAPSLCDADWKPPVYEKAKEEREALARIVRSSHDSKLQMLFGNVDNEAFEMIIDALFLKEVLEGEHVIKQGDEGDYFYIVKSGKFDILVAKAGSESKKVFEAGPGFAFGELALLYNSPRSATIVATVASTVWCLERVVFQMLVIGSAQKKFKENVEFLKQCDIFQVLSEDERASLAEVLEEEEFAEDEAILRQGERDDQMFIIKDGAAVACIHGEAGEVEVMQYSKGTYFGEIALLTGEARKASVYAVGTCKCLYITRDTFKRMMGPLSSILERNIGQYSKYADSIAEAQDFEANQGTPINVIDGKRKSAARIRHFRAKEEKALRALAPSKSMRSLPKEEEQCTPEASEGVGAKPAEAPAAEGISLKDRVAQDFTKPALVKPSDEFVIGEAHLEAFGGLRLGEKFKMQKSFEVRSKVQPARKSQASDTPETPGFEEDVYTWHGPTKLKGVTQVAVLCQKGQKSACDPTPNQDNFFITYIGPVAVYGVCDGHGPFGHLVSFRLVQSLPHHLKESEHFGKDWEKALAEAFSKSQEDLLGFCAKNDVNTDASGSTCSMLVFEEQTVHMAFIGDSRIMLGSWNRHDQRLIHGTEDHKPELERGRLEAAGMEVREIDEGNYRIYLPGSNFPGLTMSRAFGDTACKGLIQEPTYTKFLMQPGDEWYAVVASDGVWEFLEAADALNLTAKKLRLKGATETVQFLVGAARKRWEHVCGDYCDDITAILIQWNAHDKGGSGNHTLTFRHPETMGWAAKFAS